MSTIFSIIIELNSLPEIFSEAIYGLRTTVLPKQRQLVVPEGIECLKQWASSWHIHKIVPRVKLLLNCASRSVISNGNGNCLNWNKWLACIEGILYYVCCSDFRYHHVRVRAEQNLPYRQCNYLQYQSIQYTRLWFILDNKNWCMCCCWVSFVPAYSVVCVWNLVSLRFDLPLEIAFRRHGNSIR